MKIGVLIPTRGDRPQFLERAKLYLIRQTRQPDRVLFFDSPPTSDQPDITFRYRNGCEILFRAGCDVVFFMEDDDWYAPDYIELMMAAWEAKGKPSLFGINKTLYYHIRTQEWSEIRTTGRASMCCMCAGPGILKVQWPADNDPFTDYKLASKCRVVTAEVSPRWLVVGIKHGVGKCGGSAHSNRFKYAEQDRDYKLLASIVGDDLPFYRSIGQKPVQRAPKRLHVAIVSAVWQRPDVFEYFAAGIAELMVHCRDIQFTVIIAGSEGRRSRKMVEQRGFKYIEVPNEPLAAKHNATTAAAASFLPDYVMCIGSDDIITPEAMKVYEEHMRRGIDYIAVTDFYFYDTVTKRAAYWAGYRGNRAGHTCGAGRLISARLMKAWNWRPWELKHNRVLDNSMQEKLKTTKHTSAIFSLKEKGVYALDVKSKTNMTPFQLWDNTQYIPEAELKKHFPYVIK